MNREQFFEAVNDITLAADEGSCDALEATWLAHHSALRGSRGIFHVREPRFFKRFLPPDQQFRKKGFLRALLKSRRIVLCGNADEGLQPSFTFTISFDSNFASYLRTYVEGHRLGGVQDGFVEALKFLMPYREGVDIMLYLFETANLPDRAKVHQTIRAYCVFRSADPEFFRKKRILQATISDSEIDCMVQGCIELSERNADWAKLAGLAYQRRTIAYVVFAKAAELQFKYGQKSPEKRFGMLLEFLEGELGFFPKHEMLAAARFLLAPKGDRIFRIVDQGAKNLAGKLNGIAWDFSHLRTILDWSVLNGVFNKHHADFPIPYFLSFDYGIIEMVEMFRLNGILLRASDGTPAAVPIYDLATEAQYGEFAGKHPHYFTSSARELRVARAAELAKDETHLDRLASAVTLGLPVSKSD